MARIDWYTWTRRLKIAFYLAVIFSVFMVLVLEVKHQYNINILPEVNGPLDDYYFRLKDKLFK